MSRIDDLVERIQRLERIQLQFCPKCNHNTLQSVIGCGYYQCTNCGEDLKRGIVQVNLKEEKSAKA